MNIDIQTTVTVIFILLLLAGGGIIITAFRAFREAKRLRFFLKRRKILGRAWKLIFYAVLIITAAFLVNRYAEPMTYQVFEPSPTATLTPTITLTYTVTQTSTVTLTPTMTETPEFTSTPIMPAVISEGFTSEVTPNPESVFSNLIFARRLTGEYLPIDPNVRFDQPNTVIYGSFSYDKMIPGAQWSALWFRDGELIDYESIPWNGASGGYGYTDITLPSDEWLPGFFEVQIFVGDIWKTSGYFEVFGDPPTPTLTSTATITPTLTETAVNTATIIPTETLKPSETPQPTLTSTGTMIPTLTATLTATELPTQTPTKTDIPTQTLTPTATRRSTIFR
jgi:type VI secretion system secreted protein VgrG